MVRTVHWRYSYAGSVLQNRQVMGKNVQGNHGVSRISKSVLLLVAARKLIRVYRLVGR